MQAPTWTTPDGDEIALSERPAWLARSSQFRDAWEATLERAARDALGLGRVELAIRVERVVAARLGDADVATNAAVSFCALVQISSGAPYDPPGAPCAPSFSSACGRSRRASVVVVPSAQRTVRVYAGSEFCTQLTPSRE